MQFYIEVLIAILLLVLVIERFFGNKGIQKKHTQKAVEKDVKKKKSSSIMGETKPISKVKEIVKKIPKPTVEKQERTTKTIIPKEELDEVFSSSDNDKIIPEEWDLVEEEELQAIVSSETDNDFATGLSYEELQKIPQLIEKTAFTKENVSLAMKLSDTDLLDSLNEQIPEAQQRVSDLLNRYLNTPKTKNDDWESFDIREFV